VKGAQSRLLAQALILFEHMKGGVWNANANRGLCLHTCRGGTAHQTQKNGTAYLTSKIWNTLVVSRCGTHGEVTMMEHIYSYESLLLAIWKLDSCFFVQSFD